MDKPVIIIEAPELNDEAVTSVYQFLQDLVLAFESHYYLQLVRHGHHCCTPNSDDEKNGP